MNFQERFKGKTSQISKDPTASIIDTSDKMKVDFNNMKPCDVFEITRSYTPSVKSEIDVPTRNSHNVHQLNNTDKGQFRRPAKTMSQKVFSKQDSQTQGGSEYARTQQSIFSAIQNNFDNNDTISDIFSPINNKKQITQKQMEKSKFQESPALFKLATPPHIMVDNTPNSPFKIEKSSTLFSQKVQPSNPQQIFQAKLAKERSQSNNFQRIGSYLAKSLPQQQQQIEPYLQKTGMDLEILKENTPYNNRKLTTEQSDSLFAQNCIDNHESSKSMMNSCRSKNIEKNIISQNKSVTKHMTDHGYKIQNNPEGVTYTLESEAQQCGTPKKMLLSFPVHQVQPSISISQAHQDEYLQNYGFLSGGFIEMTQSEPNTSNNTRRIRSHLGFNDSLRKLTPNNPDGKQQDVLEDLEQFISGLNHHTSNSTSQLQSRGGNNTSTNNNNNNNSNNNNKILQNQQLWMNKQFSQMIPTDSLQNQINHIQMKREEEEALIAYKNQFNYKQMNNRRQAGNNSSLLPQQWIESPQASYQKANENFQQMSEDAMNNNQYQILSISHQSSVQSGTSQNTPSNNANANRQKSYSSQQAKPNPSQRMALNIK